MGPDHEYALIGGFNRAKVGRYLAMLAAGFSALAVFLSASLGSLLEARGIAREWTGWLASAVSAGVVWTGLYWLLDNWLWRWPRLGEMLGVPDLSGRWTVVGQTLNPDRTPGTAWQATLTISQKWDKLRVHLATGQSSSTSITAAILCESGVGWRLFYTYKNEPRAGELDLQPHRGSADLLFARDLQSGRGEYFNGLGRFTFGTMDLTREVG